MALMKVSVNRISYSFCDIGICSRSFRSRKETHRVLAVKCTKTLYTLYLKKTGPLRIIWHNFTNSQRLLINFGRERPYSILKWYDKKFLNWFRTSFMVTIATVVTWRTRTANFWAVFEQRFINRAINEWKNNCGSVSRPKDCSLNTCCNFWHCTLFR